MLEESARISRGAISPVDSLEIKKFDALFIPGGFGVAKNFSDFASKATEMTVDSEVAQVILNFYNSKKPIGATCIAPIVLAKVLGTVSAMPGIDLTLGKKGPDWPYSGSIEAASKFGNKVVSCDVDEICKDRYAKIITTPAYMKENAKPCEVFDGIEKLVKEVIKLTKE